MRWRVRRPGPDLACDGMEPLVHGVSPSYTSGPMLDSGGALRRTAGGLLGGACLDLRGERVDAARQRVHVLRGGQADAVDGAADALLERLLERGEALVCDAGEILDDIVGLDAALRRELLALLDGECEHLAGLVTGGLEGLAVGVQDDV